MFSFWSKDDEEDSDCNDENDSEKVKIGVKPERFLYVGNDKKDERVRDKSPNLLTSNAVIQNIRNTNDFNERKRRMDDMLSNVWSVRKDVPVNVAKAAKDTQIGSKSFYSRHGEISGTGIATKTWSVAKTNYSYSDSTQINQCDILENNVVTDAVSQIAPSDHGDDVQRQNIVNSMKYGTVTAPNSTNREPSARTRRAQKFNNAYLRSTGLGKYTPEMSKSSELHHNNKWKR